MTIRQVPDTGKEAFKDLLLEADEHWPMVLKYLGRCALFVMCEEGRTIGEIALTDEGNGVLEIKSLAVREEMRGQGRGRKLVLFAVEKAIEGGFTTLRVGTGDSPSTIPFYEKLGFRRAGIIKGFFTDNYPEPIIDGGVLLDDMVVLEKDLREEARDNPG